MNSSNVLGGGGKAWGNAETGEHRTVSQVGVQNGQTNGIKDGQNTRDNKRKKEPKTKMLREVIKMAQTKV